MPTPTASSFLDAIQKWLRRNGGTVYGTTAQRTDPTERGYVPIGNLADGTFWVETDTLAIYQKRTASDGSASWVRLTETIITSHALSAASTTVDPPAAGVFWVAILQQDVTGGRAVVWGAGIIAASVSLGTALASSYSVFLFVNSGGTWLQVAQQTTDML